MKKIIITSLFAAILLLFVRHFFREGFPVTHDGNNHLVRFANYKIAVRELQIPPRLAPNLVNGYGYPVFNYNYPLANLLSLPFSVLNIHYEVTFKILFSLSMLTALLGAIYFLKEQKFPLSARVFALAVFMLNPYILTSIIFRGNIGEVMAFALLPWIFYFLNVRKFYHFSFALALLFLSHNISAFFASLLLIFYALFTIKGFMLWKKFTISFVVAFAMTLWFWLPAIFEKQYITLDGVDLTLNYYHHFPSISQLFRIPIEFGYSYWGQVDSMSLGLGFMQGVLLFFALMFCITKKSKQQQVWFITLFVLFLAQLSWSKVLYEYIPFANFIQFPWRMALLYAVALLPLSAFLFTKLQRPWQIIFWMILLLQFWQLWQVKPIDYNHKNIIDYDADTSTTSVNQENMPKTFSFPFFGNKEAPVLMLTGQGTIEPHAIYGSKKYYSLNLSETSTIVESTAFFPGWETHANGQLLEYIDNEQIQGRIAYQLPAGAYEVESKFTQKTWQRLLGNSISLIVFALFAYKWGMQIKQHSKTE